MKKLIAIAVIICMSLAMIYIMNQSPVWLWALTFGTVGCAFLIMFVWSCCKLSSIATEREDEILLSEWRKGLTPE
jgi:TRAP-type C4-dicarboxylate transport system permease small subunit